MTRDLDQFGLPDLLTRDEAELLLKELEQIWSDQTSTQTADLGSDLQSLKEWFDPVAKGDRLRRALASAPKGPETRSLPDPLIYRLSEDRCLITPEGRVAIEILRNALANKAVASGNRILPSSSADAFAVSLLDLYRDWSRQRLNDVSGLLKSETSTLRPGAAGLLLVLLLNRNIGTDQALPLPKDVDRRSIVEAAIREPALAWATEFTGRPASGASADLYRGWAIPELARRLGSGLHRENDVIYIEPNAVELAIGRLLDDLRARPTNARGRIPGAWNALLDAYGRSRPRLAGLGLAYERPSFTSELGRRLIEVTQVHGSTTEPNDQAE